MAGKTQFQYEKILEQSRLAGEIIGEPDGRERRTHPRMKAKSEDLRISSIPEFSIIDMSLSGMAVLSNHPLGEGEMIEINLGDTLKADAVVVGCRMEESTSEFLDSHFRIQCKFNEDYKGMELLVKIKSN